MTKYVLNHWLREKQAIIDLSAALEMVNLPGADAQEAMRASQARETPNFPGTAQFS